MRKITTPLSEYGGQQHFCDGVATAYNVINSAEKGDRPSYTPEILYERIPFEYKTAGIKRKYYAQKEGQEFDSIIRIDAAYRLSRSNMITISDDIFKIISISEIYSVYPNIKELTIRKVRDINECVE